MKLLIIVIAALLTNSVGILLSQSYYRHCSLGIRYEGPCLCIQNRNVTGCPSLGKISAVEGHVLGYCDVITSLDRDADRIPDVLLVRKCKPECRRSCSETGAYFCEQIFTYMTVKRNGSDWVMQLPSDCLCVKNTTRIDKIEEEYGVKAP